MAFLIIKYSIKKILPSKAWKFFKRIYYFFPYIYDSFYYRSVQWRYKGIVKRIRKKDKIKVAFLLIHDSVWKYEGVYRLMEQDERFEPVVVVCPYIVYGEETMLRTMDQSYNTFSVNGYNVVKTYNDVTKEWLDVKKEIKPDIVFFTNPHKLTKDEYYITNFLDCLTNYVQYSFHITYLNEMQYNQQFHNLLWKAFYETPMHGQLAKQYAINKGYNVTITGYPGTDNFIDKQYTPNDPWKIKDRNVKRIIWAPHHTIEGEGVTLDYSNFLQYADFFLKMAAKYNGQIQIAFKPHPALKPKLCKDNIWGNAKTEDYYSNWDNLPNGQLNESEYIDLFLTSDAMIHDSASFMTEYLYTNKPVLYTVKDSDLVKRFNDFGKLSFQLHYHANNEIDIDNFIKNIVIGNKDIMKLKRELFIKNYLMPPNGKSASQNIIDEIRNCL